jgi:hypothetical protein
MDPVVLRLRTLATAEAMLGDTLRAGLAAAMLELYLVGRIDVTFDDQGEPMAHLITHTAPLVHMPMFTPPPLDLDGTPAEENKRRIGFTVN